jgi:hypothetical protein
VSKGVNDTVKAVSSLGQKAQSSAEKTASKAVSKGLKALKSGGDEVASVAASVVKTAKKDDWGGKVESLKQHLPESAVKATFKAGLIAAGSSPEEADAMAGAASAGLYAYDFGDAPSSKNAANAGKAAIKSGISSAAKSSTKSKSTEGAGFGNIAHDKAKEALLTGKLKSAVKSAQYDPNKQFVKGGSMIAHGGSFKSHGEGLGAAPASMVSHGGRLIAGSQAAKDRMAHLRSLRK